MLTISGEDASRFETAAARLGFGKRNLSLRTDLFTAPAPGGQLSLF